MIAKLANIRQNKLAASQRQAKVSALLWHTREIQAKKNIFKVYENPKNECSHLFLFWTFKYTIERVLLYLFDNCKISPPALSEELSISPPSPYLEPSVPMLWT